MIRRLLPALMLPLALLACGLSASPWLRAFPASVLAVPLFGAALLSVLLPVVVIGVGLRRLWLTALIDIVGFVFFTTLVALREPVGFADLWNGLVHGPSQILTFALPLVGPRTLLVAPVALCWLAGAVLGESLGRGWPSVTPYAGLVVTFGLAYAASARAVTSAADGRRYDTLLAGGLLLVLLLLRLLQTWLDQDQAAESTQPDGVLPYRGLVMGTTVTALVAVLAALVVQLPAFSSSATTPQRTPPVAHTRPLTPLAFVASLRPRQPGSHGTPLFTVTMSGAASRYVTIANVDTYNGDSWSFSRTFRPSGGAIPSDPDPDLRPGGHGVTQLYTIAGGRLAGAPWMPYLDRPEQVAGAPIDVDPTTGMILPATPLRAGRQYSVVSTSPTTTIGDLGTRAQPAATGDYADLHLPGEVSTFLRPVLNSFHIETGTTASTPALQFLEDLTKDLHANYGLAGGPTASGAQTSGTPTSGTPTSRAPSTRASSGRVSSPSSAHPSSSTKSGHPSSGKKSGTHTAGRSTPTSSGPTPSPTPSSTSGSRTTSGGGTNLASVLASILSTNPSATPEQYATLVALIARKLNIPARVATGFRIPGPSTGGSVAAGSYTVTTADAWSWVEIPVVGKGWVVLDPSPTRGSVGQAPASQSGRPTVSSSSANPTYSLSSPSPITIRTAPPGIPETGNGSLSSGQLVSIAAAVVVVAALAVLAFLFLRKRARLRRRRRRRDPRRRLLGAWEESLDVLVESGLPDPSALTSTEVTGATEEAFGTEPAERIRFLGEAANVALFSPTTWVSSDQADAAWQAEVTLRRAVRRQQTVRERLNCALRYHRPPPRHDAEGPASWAATTRTRNVEALTSARLRRARSGTVAGRRRTH